uniref:hypothetical protein n=1 Tax=Microbulbifer agarilyticus TaxID=260552 RepID=UPI00025586C6|nr:hypothetical protein [Microbulbifer agarilyticus]
MALVKFSTRLIPPEKWNEAFEEVFSPICGADLDLGQRAPATDVDVCVLPGMGISNNRIGAHKAYRSHRHIVDGDDSIVVAIPRTGQLTIDFANRGAQRCAVGNLLVASSDTPFTAENEYFLHSSVFSVQRSWFESQFGGSASLVNCVRTPANLQALRLLLKYSDNVIGNGHFFEERAAQLSVVHMHELLALALGAQPVSDAVDAGAVADSVKK